MSALLLSPFVIFVGACIWRAVTVHPAIHWGGNGSGAGLSTAILVGLWNYMGWDNASTVAQEVENPQRNYPRAMIASIILVTVTYVVPLAAMGLTGLAAGSFSTGDWTIAAREVGGPLLGWAVVAGGCITGVGIFNALVMSYTRLPMAMAQDGMFPARWHAPTAAACRGSACWLADSPGHLPSTCPSSASSPLT